MSSKRAAVIHSSLLFDPQTGEFVPNQSIVVDRVTGSIYDVFERESDREIRDGDIDLRGKIVMPGLVDSHTHIFLHSYDERSSIEQMRDESIVERVVRATNHVREALLAGYTTYRDLGTEAMQNFDANLRDCVNRGIIPGPRLFVATHALASTASYEVRTENRANGLQVPQASDAADGVDGVRRAVRQRVGDGADLIKFYADYRRKTMRFPTYNGPVQFPPADPNPEVPLFSQEEMNTIVSEAALAGLPVAAHAGTVRAATMAVKAGVTSLEHVFESTDELFIEMVRRGCIYVPTLSVAERLAKEKFPLISLRVKRAYDLGVRLAAGGDTGAFPHGENAREIELMIAAGIPVEDALEAGTVGGWEACGKDACGFRFGWFEKGNRADIIALNADPREDKTALRKVDFVMKDGKVWKQDGVAVGMAQEHTWDDTADDDGWVKV